VSGLGWHSERALLSLVGMPCPSLANRMALVGRGAWAARAGAACGTSSSKPSLRNYNRVADTAGSSCVMPYTQSNNKALLVSDGLKEGEALSSAGVAAG
jgi:hypothetical protein